MGKKANGKKTKLNDMFISIGNKKFPIDDIIIEEMVETAMCNIYDNDEVSNEIDGLILDKLIDTFKNTNILEGKELRAQIVYLVEGKLHELFDESNSYPQKTQKRITKMKNTILEELTDDELKKVMKKKLLSL